MTTIAARLANLRIDLPPTSLLIGNCVPFVLSGSLLLVSGQGAKGADSQWLRGRVGEDVSAEDAYGHVRLAGIRILAAVNAALGDLERMQRVVKVAGFVNAVPRFGAHSEVINGCSDLFVEIFGERGRHARSAIGVSALPEGITVEIEAVLEVI
jgi:enamine deaminase RidA (YjgF/YER057c/UK114 family)